MVSLGLKEVWTEAIEEAGDWAARNLERNRRLYLRGMGFGIEGHAKGIFALVNGGGREFDLD
jgi:hypothetical protein